NLTPNVPGFAGLEAACRWLAGRDVGELHRRQLALRERLAGRLAELSGVRLWGYEPGAPAVGILSFTVDGRDNGELAAWLDRERGLGLRVGLHCAPAAHRRLGCFPAGTLRAGIGPFLDERDVDALVAALEEVVR
ncbi:MAG TPA: aminotransferase class V-fold PLP-dependent enzyme, partial [Acidobacteria bacterium]|nr:aminotransferase class V-fold PLP-dependent enzyme [Acidobacteriota bacterium]